MAGLRAAIDESQQAYTVYTVQAQQALATLESGGFDGADALEILIDASGIGVARLGSGIDSLIDDRIRNDLGKGRP